MSWILYVAAGAVGGLYPVGVWLLRKQNREKEKFSRIKVLRSAAAGAVFGGVVGGAYNDIFLALTNGIAGEAILSLILKTISNQK